MSISLVNLKLNEVAVVKDVISKNRDVHRLIDMGITKGTRLRLTNYTSNKGPIQIKIRDYYIAIRYNLAKSIVVQTENE